MKLIYEFSGAVYLRNEFLTHLEAAERLGGADGRGAQEAQGVHEQYRVTDDGITLWHVSQMFGIRLKDLAKINNLHPDAVLQKGDLIKLKKNAE